MKVSVKYFGSEVLSKMKKIRIISELRNRPERDKIRDILGSAICEIQNLMEDRKLIRGVLNRKSCMCLLSWRSKAPWE